MRIALSTTLALTLLSPLANAQQCTAPAQVCAAGANGDGGCFVPGAALCVAGMICESALLVCPPGLKGEGGCFDPATQACNAGALAAVSAAPTTAPAKGNAAPLGCLTALGQDRKAILDALRTPVAAVLNAPVEFKVERIRICGDWVFALATPQSPGGGEMHWAGTPCDGDTSHLAGGLMRRSGGGWALVEYALCPSDVAWADWPDRYHVPQILFDE
jgi:hypothetical protein